MLERQPDVSTESNKIAKKNEMEDFLRLECIDQQASFPLLEERDAQGELLEADVQWIRLVDGDRVVEGKLYVPKTTEKRELVTFNPGYPGDSITMFESDYVPAMIKAGYAVFASRHSGLSVEEKMPDKYVHCPEKKQWAVGHEQTNLGQTFSPENCGHEVATTIKGLEGLFDKIHCVGHSGGVLNTFTSLMHLAQERPEVLKKINKVISMAGVVGPYDYELISKIFDWIKSKGYFVMAEDTPENTAQFKQQIERLQEFDWSTIPDMKTMFVIPNKVKGLGGEKDEYIDPVRTKEFADFMRSQGCEDTRVVDYVSRPNKTAGKESHDLASLAPKVVVMNWLTGKFEQDYQRYLERGST